MKIQGNSTNKTILMNTQRWQIDLLLQFK